MQTSGIDLQYNVFRYYYDDLQIYWLVHAWCEAVHVVKNIFQALSSRFPISSCTWGKRCWLCCREFSLPKMRKRLITHLCKQKETTTTRCWLEETLWLPLRFWMSYRTCFFSCVLSPNMDTIFGWTSGWNENGCVVHDRHQHLTLTAYVLSITTHAWYSS